MVVTYKITNIVTGEYYFGVHRTDDFLSDDYYGSGKLIKESVKKYGKKNHRKDVLAFFDNREQATELEHELVKKHESDKLCLNLNDGGGFAVVLKAEKLHEDMCAAYEASPKYCKACGKLIPYRRRENEYCSNSCAAKVNNVIREIAIANGIDKVAYGRKIIHCLYCGKEMRLPASSPKKYCNNSCQRKHQIAQGIGPKDARTERLRMDIDKIRERHDSGESYSRIALDYKVSKNRICELLKNGR